MRLWHSSPICSAWAMRLRTSTGPRAAQHPGQQRAEHLLQPAQPGDHLRRVRAVAEHLAEPLIQRAVRAAAVRGVLKHRDRHRRAHHSGHRAHRAARMARRQRHAAAGRDPAGLFHVAGQSLVHHGPGQRPAQRPRRVGPADRRARVQQLARRQAQGLAGRDNVHPVRAGGGHPADGLSSGGAGPVIGRDGGQAGFGPGYRRGPLHLARRGGLRPEGVGEQRRARP